MPRIALVVIALCLGLVACGDEQSASRTASSRGQTPDSACVRSWNASTTAREAGGLAWSAKVPAALVERDGHGRCVVALDPRACGGRSGGVVFSGAWTFVRRDGRWRELIPQPGPRFQAALSDGLRRLRAIETRPNARITSERGELV